MMHKWLKLDEHMITESSIYMAVHHSNYCRAWLIAISENVSVLPFVGESRLREACINVISIGLLSYAPLKFRSFLCLDC